MLSYTHIFEKISSIDMGFIDKQQLICMAELLDGMMNVAAEHDHSLFLEQQVQVVFSSFP